jgi:hypothetical protein
MGFVAGRRVMANVARGPFSHAAQSLSAIPRFVILLIIAHAIRASVR